MTVTTKTSVLNDAIDAVVDASDKVFRSLTGIVDRLERDATGLLTSAKTTVHCSCERPHACWLPDELPAITSVVCPGGTARVRFTVRNCGLAPRQVILGATGPDAGLALGAPSQVTIGALESAELVAVVTLPHDTESATLTLWVRGCHDTAVPWTVIASDKGCDATHEVAVEDCPSTYHYWHDHFAQPRPCRHRAND